jgi:malonyl-ACP decarboxylase
MPNRPLNEPAVSVVGLGVACGAGFGITAFKQALSGAVDLFGYLQRPGREPDPDSPPFIGVEMPEPSGALSPRLARTASFSGRVAVAVLEEAWETAGLDRVPPDRIGLIVGGSNLMSREVSLAVREYADRLSFVSPRHGYMLSDSDICALCCATFPIRGFAFTLAAASASGSAALVQGLAAIRSRRVDACIVLGALQDVSAHDLQAMRALGAMGSYQYSDAPGRACRPMDKDHDGFIFGESSAAIVLCRSGEEPGPISYGQILGAAHISDGTRGPEPNTNAQVRAAKAALSQAGVSVADIDYVNGHATGTKAGDLAELETYRSLGLGHARINATKSILGHGLAAAGAVETAATLVQINSGFVHSTRNLENPIDDRFAWVGPVSEPHDIRLALKFSFGFGGVNTAIVLGAADKAQAFA